ncbi:MAG: hypothetical protein ABI286_01610 [Edaphobacter sp.]
MPLFISSKKYEISVRVLGGEGDGPLIYIDNQGHLHVVGGDPRIDREKVLAATRQVEAAAAAFAVAIAGLRAQ